MKSSIRLLLTICVSFLLMMVAGCGSDKYSGTWIQTLDSLHEGTVVRQVNIEKNDTTFLVEKEDIKGAIAHFADIPSDLRDDIELKNLLGALYYSDMLG